MPNDDPAKKIRGHPHDEDNEEARSLLSESSNDSGNDPTINHSGPPPPPPRPKHTHRQSSISYPPPNGSPRTPRTPNRVRFDLDERLSHDGRANGHARAPSNASSLDWMEDEDYLAANNSASTARGGRRSSTGQRAPLLTDIEAPSVTLASEDFSAEELLESARPKSGMRSAFMNMANSIM